MIGYYVNVSEWTPMQVADWMRGLDDTLLPYIHFIMEKEINGHRLLSTTVEDLPVFFIDKLGHQEIFMGAIDLLRDFHYNLDRENLQYLAMQLGCKARSLYNELRTTFQSNGKSEQVTTSTLAAVADIIDGVKDLVSWLDRAPFDGHEPYLSVKGYLLKICLELATNAQRDLFAEQPVQVIREGCISLCEITDRIIRDFVDPLVLQPASLDVATVKKKPEEDLVLVNSHPISNSVDGLDLWIQGMLIQTSYKGVHVVGGVKFQSPAHQCGKIEEGDEVVQVNYQTVVGWQQKKLKAAMLENSTKVILTLKKRPRHSNNFGQIYVKPYRLPSKKRESYNFRWHLNDGQSKTSEVQPTKPEMIASVPTVQIAPPATTEVTAADLPSEVESDNDTDDDSFLPDNHHDPVAAAAAAAVAAATGTDGSIAGVAASPASVRLILPKNRLSIQRRATVTGASPTSSRPPINIEQFWKELKEGQRAKAPELFDLLLQQHQQMEQRPHSSMDHYHGRQIHLSRQTDWNANHQVQPESTENIGKDGEDAVLKIFREKKTGSSAAHSTFVKAKINEDALNESNTDPNSIMRDHIEGNNSDEVEMRSPSRKISLERPRLDKSQSTPAYESVVTDSASFEEKLRDIRLRKQSRVEEEFSPLSEVPSHSPTPSPISKDAPPLSPKPALPPRNKIRPQMEELHVDSSSPPSIAIIPAHTLPTEQTTISMPLATTTNDLHQITPPFNDENAIGLTLESPGHSNPPSPPHELSHLGLRPHEIRDLVRRGLWPRNPTDEDRALPALTRVTRLDSNFDPVPGSTVPRIAPSLLTYSPLPRHDEEVHVALPPLKPIGHYFGGHHQSPVGGSRNYHHLQFPAQLQQQQQQQPQFSKERSPLVDGSHRRIACRELGEVDCQGWLYRRRQTTGFWSGPRWTRRFFVLKRHTLYGFRDPEDQKAESLIFLPGFSAAPGGTEVKSKKFSFKIFNSGTMFYFACETKEELNKWICTVMQSATATHVNSFDGVQSHKETALVAKGAYYSETEDESLDEGENPKGSLSRSLGRRKGKVPVGLPSNKMVFGASATLGRPKRMLESPSPPSTGEKSPRSNKPSRSPMASLDRKYLTRFLRVAPEKQPVPTPQFRSYRKPSLSPSPSPTTLLAPSIVSSNSLQAEISSLDNSKPRPPPRPPSESKPTSPFKPQPSPLMKKEPVNHNSSLFDFPSEPTFTSRHSVEPSANQPDPAEAINTFRKSISTLKLSSSQQQQRSPSTTIETDFIAKNVAERGVEEQQQTSNVVSPRRSIIRRHSVEIGESKKQGPKSPSTKPQLAPKPVGYRLLNRNGSGSLSQGSPGSPLEATHRRALYGSLNRSIGVDDVENIDTSESGYAKIKPRKSSNASDYFRVSGNGPDSSASPNRIDGSTGRRSSITSSRRSSTDGGSLKSGVGGSLSKLHSPSLSPGTPNKGIFDFSVDPSGNGYRQGPPDQLWKNSLRSSGGGIPPAIAPKPGWNPDRVKNSAGAIRLKSTACYQPMNFPLSPKDDSKMQAAFEMNLDTSPTSISTASNDQSADVNKAQSFFKMLVSPKFGRKTPSPLVGAKTKTSPDSTISPPATTPRIHKTLLGSPRLHRAIFGRDKRKKLSESGGLQSPNSVVFEETTGATMSMSSSIDSERCVTKDSASFNSSVSSNYSAGYSPSLRSPHRPPPLMAPAQAYSIPSSIGSTLPDDGNFGSCPGTPKTPLLKPAMGTVIVRQRRTPLATDGLSISSPPLSPQSSSGGGLLRHSSLSTSSSALNHFSYTSTPKENSLSQSLAAPAAAAPSLPPLLQSFQSSCSGELQYPPIFEPETYSLSEKNVEMHITSSRSSAASMGNSSTLPPIPAPRTKFLMSQSPSVDSALGSTSTSAICHQHRVVQVQLETKSLLGCGDESSNA